MPEIDLTPNEAMVSAALKGLELAVDPRHRRIEPALKARARRIASGKKLTPAQVKRMRSYFSRSPERTASWGEAGKETISFVAHMMWGGDAGKVWTQARFRDNGELAFADDEETVVFRELYFADGNSMVDEDGMIWKAVLRTGRWVEGPNGQPLKVVAGRSANQRKAIGLQDIIDAYEAGAVEHVTIPTSHDDKVHENTGFIRGLRVGADPDGGVRLYAAHDFTEAHIKEMVERGTIPNVSCGLQYDYTRKVDGKKFPIVLKHVALTSKPWINRLTPFGVSASDESPLYDISALTFSEPLDESEEALPAAWDGALTFDEVRDAIAEQVDVVIVEVATDRVLLKASESTNFVAHFTIDDGEVIVEPRDKWIEQGSEISVENPPNTSLEDGDVNNPETTSASGSDPMIGGNLSTDGETHMADKDPAPITPPDNPPKPDPQVVELSTKMKSVEDENAALRAQVDRLRHNERTNDANSYVEHLKSIGFSEQRGCTAFLKRVRTILLSDEGETSILLAEGDEAPQPITATVLVKSLLDSLPTENGKLKVQLSEQQTDPLGASGGDKPPVDAEGENLSDAEREAQADELFVTMFPSQGRLLKPQAKE